MTSTKELVHNIKYKSLRSAIFILNFFWCGIVCNDVVCNMITFTMMVCICNIWTWRPMKYAKLQGMPLEKVCMLLGYTFHLLFYIFKL